MIYQCPHCGARNQVAGWRGWVYRMDGKEIRDTLCCWRCRRTVTQEDLDKAKEQPIYEKVVKMTTMRKV